MRLSPAIAALTATVCATSAYAGAWTQDAGHGVVILTGDYYNADHLWNNRGDKQSQPTYDKYELNPYGEYGVLNWLTVGTNLSFQRAHQDGNPDHTHWGMGDSEFFARTRLWQGGGFLVSAEPMIKLPSPESGNSNPRLGGSHPDAGMGLNGGYGWSAWGHNHFADIDTQYRYRFGSPKNQVKISGTLGLSVTDRWMLMPQVFTTFRTSSPKAAAFTNSPADDYNEIKLQLSAVYKATDTVWVQVGGFADVDGKNVGEGRGGLISLWKKF